MNNNDGNNNNLKFFNSNVIPQQNQQTQMLNQMNIGNNDTQPVNQNNNNIVGFNDNNQNGGQFFNQNNQVYNETSINDLNVDGAYNRMNIAPEYVNEKQVRENMEVPKKNTVPISKELKTVFIIALILLAFIIVMPMLFDLISNLRFH